jgi:hypothetical protein
MTLHNDLDSSFTYRFPVLRAQAGLVMLAGLACCDMLLSLGSLNQSAAFLITYLGWTTINGAWCAASSAAFSSGCSGKISNDCQKLFLSNIWGSVGIR